MDKLVCPRCLNIYTDLEYIIQTNKVCHRLSVTGLNKMKILYNQVRKLVWPAKLNIFRLQDRDQMSPGCNYQNDSSFG